MSNDKKMKTKWVGITIVDRSKVEEKSQIFEGRIENKLSADEISIEQFKNNRLKKKKKKKIEKKKITPKESIKCPKCNTDLSADHEKMQNHFKTCMSNISKEEREHIIETIDETIFKLDSIEIIKEFKRIVNIFSNPHGKSKLSIYKV